MMSAPQSKPCRRAGLIARIRLIVGGDLTMGNSDPGLAESFSGRVPARCVFQFSGADGVESAFPVEYVMRMMNDWAGGECDPYIKIQNTGVSVLIEGFFAPPTNAARAPLCADKVNVLLNTTDSTGVVLSDIKRFKKSVGVDCRPFQACLNVHCFVRLPNVQLAFRFVGPTDPARTSKLLDSAVASYNSKAKQRFKNSSRAIDNESRPCALHECVPIPVRDETQKLTSQSDIRTPRRVLTILKKISSGEYVTTVRVSIRKIILCLVSVFVVITAWWCYPL
ncbi:UL34 protein [Gallid alphaherpesvirus 3]|uniref:UL34 protein n=2 Tax=Gallid alphaherpesvirus 3 TaxID=35250 RepID=A0A1P7U0T4_9ALPH|nr:nuclear egress membrane protein [Gallid alphaherpesvirus 3]YP_010795631.1 UL34 protein [Gallid alphaherpesvirus 3]BAA78723.1 UL34 protein [Marek's disease virus serotype 2 MDV2]AEI00240.1 UL34 protein [Gallid alphaherpesvirus 3]QEY02264.1 UL34 protein [Gallid alphaherpesvirus 3]BAA82930.1 UL34 product homolog [Marek's disease virus serotype 2 MDV2]BAB16544.1 UL34 protein [Gallid alphaherpesvirus 3]